MGADYPFYVKFIATRAPTFFGYIISVLPSVRWGRLGHLDRLGSLGFGEKSQIFVISCAAYGAQRLHCKERFTKDSQITTFFSKFTTSTIAKLGPLPK